MLFCCFVCQLVTFNVCGGKVLYVFIIVYYLNVLFVNSVFVGDTSYVFTVHKTLLSLSVDVLVALLYVSLKLIDDRLRAYGEPKEHVKFSTGHNSTHFF